MSRPSRAVLAALIVCAGSACDAAYFVRGDVVVPPAAVRKAGTPALVCEGRGERPDRPGSSYGHPVGRGADFRVTVFCAVPERELVLPLDLFIMTSGRPPQGIVRSWLAPVPAAGPLCNVSELDGTIGVDRDDLARLIAPAESARPIDHGLVLAKACGLGPPPGAPSDFAAVFDPDNKTWNDQDGTEHRALTLH